MAEQGARPRDGVGADEPRYRIGLVARKVGVAAHTLRAWERRYHSLTPGRAEGGGRLYSDSDVERLRMLRQLTEHGHAIGSVASLPNEELVRLLSQTRAANEPWPLEAVAAHTLLERFLSAVVAFDLARAARLVSHAALVMPVRELVCDLLGPLLHEIGVRWERGELTVAHEHAASNLLRTELGMLLRAATPPDGARTLVAATLPGEQHEFGVLLASLLATARGLKVVYLGANLPVSDVVRAAREAHAHAVLISMVNDAVDHEADLVQLREALPRSMELYVGGRAACVSEALKKKGVRSVASFDELEVLLSR